MAHIDSGGDKDINVDLNLVPFIDLMSVCIIFLLITSVWTQISMIQLGSSIYARSQDEIEPVKDDKISFDVRVTQNGYTVSINGTSNQIAKLQGKYNKKALLARLQQIKNKYQNKQDALVFVDDPVPYEELIRAMDVLMVSGFTNLSVGG
jgi:biopolymer transport protein TolR